MRAPDAPIGWPMAIAPPLTLTFAGSQPSPLLTAQACAAKASLASIEVEIVLRPASLLQRLASRPGSGRCPSRAGSTPAVAQEAMRASGVMPRRAASAAVISTTAAAPSLRPEALAAVTVPSLAKAGRSLATASSVAPARIYSSWSTTMSPLRVEIDEGNDLVLEPAGLLRRLGLVLRGDREFVLLLARDLEFAGDVLGRHAHVVAVEGVPEAVLDHGVDEARGRPSWCRRADGRHGATATSIPGRRRR